MSIQVGDIVARRSYDCDLLFRVTKVNTDTGVAMLCGEDVRLIADAPLDDLIIIDERERKKRREKIRQQEEQSFKLFRQDYRVIREKNEYHATNQYTNEQKFFELPGRVLHLDGDPLYLKKCQSLYQKLKIPVVGLHLREEEMMLRIMPLMEEYTPQILVITGHDSYSKSKGTIHDIKAYRHSKYFIETVRRARKVEPNLDQLVIFAGACQSHFESLIKAGANFASSPARINIHALDPVYVVAKVSYTPFMDRVNIWETLKNTITGEKGMGGVETKGVLRTGMPYYSYPSSQLNSSV